ncbi:di-trans,poly-cis-decaprenylcistransferase [Candidatus Woesearchaeota archaeon]|nr:di-trans,poly-cis-decaprenylcistransferase [Candidatus Woesearchaeota archaeon]
MNEVKHIAIVLDGNRRFAKRLMLEPWKGHEYGAQKTEKLLEWCKELGIKELTLYAFSMQNFNRPKNEFDYLMNLFRDNFYKLKDDKRIYENKIRINVIGRIHLFPEDVQKAMKEIMERTKHHDKYIINFAMAYGGREELIDTIKKIGRKIEDHKISAEEINEELVDNNLYMKDQPDFIIRTGGDHRTSNFLVWQSWYSEWFFLEKTWPEFEKEDLINCINEFKSREKRFGK